VIINTSLTQLMLEMLTGMYNKYDTITFNHCHIHIKFVAKLIQKIYLTNFFAFFSIICNVLLEKFRNFVAKIEK